MLEYKGYSALIEVDVEDGVISGRVLGIRDVITFEGDTVPEAVQAFHDSVDDYLAFCAERKVSPDKSYSGKFVVRIRPELHRQLAARAEAKSMSLNALVEDALKFMVRATRPKGRRLQAVSDEFSSEGDYSGSPEQVLESLAELEGSRETIIKRAIRKADTGGE